MYCGGAGRPPEAGPPPRAGELDPRTLCLALISRCGSSDHPLDGLASLLDDALGADRVRAESAEGHVTVLHVRIGDRRFEARVAGTTVVGSDVHDVGGVVIRRQELDHGGLLAELALVLAPLAGRDPGVRAALIALPTP